MIPSYEVLLNMATYSRLYLEDRILEVSRTGQDDALIQYQNELKEIDKQWWEYLRNRK